MGLAEYERKLHDLGVEHLADLQYLDEVPLYLIACILPPPARLSGD